MAGKASDLAQFEARAKRGRPRGKGTVVVYEALREEILTLKLKPGDHLDETALEKRFGVSRTPIREALIRLQADRLVRFAANRGHFVEVINLDELPRIFEAMAWFQAAVLRLAARRRTPEHVAQLRNINTAYRAAALSDDFSAMTEQNHAFHGLIGRMADNRYISDGYADVLNVLLRLTYLMFEAADHAPEPPEAYFERIYNEHAEMIDLIEAGDADRLEDISDAHTQLFSSRVAGFVQQRENLKYRPQSIDL